MYLCQCFDAIAVMLIIHTTHLHRRSMNLRRMACLVRRVVLDSAVVAWASAHARVHVPMCGPGLVL
jgi:hypothetical protein